MNHQDFINTCIFEQYQVLLFSDLSGPLNNSCINIILLILSLRPFQINVNNILFNVLKNSFGTVLLLQKFYSSQKRQIS